MTPKTTTTQKHVTSDARAPDITQSSGSGPNQSDCTVTPAEQPGATTEPPSFAALVEPILTQRCYSCHATTAPIFSNASQAIDNGAAIANSIASGHMPPGTPLSAADKAAVASWAVGGFAALALAGTPEPTYLGTIKSMIDTKCAWCHSASAPPGSRHSPYFTTYEDVKAKGGDIASQMAAGDMPPRNAVPQLGPDDSTTFAAWRAAGYPLGEAAPPIDTSTTVYYAPTIETILAQNCVSCHVEGIQAPDLSSYHAAATQGATVLASVQAGTMPPAGPLSANEKAAVQAWFDGGMLYDAQNSIPPHPTGMSTGSDTSSDTATATDAATSDPAANDSGPGSVPTGCVTEM